MFAAESRSEEDEFSDEDIRKLVHLNNFKQVLREDTKILLLHRGELHKEDDIVAVLYHSYKNGSCPHTLVVAD